MNWPRISIVTPSFNQGKFLEKTILSVINQGYPNLEYIIIDGGSTDNSLEIIAKYTSFLTHWVSEKDYGQSHAINKGFSHATGEILNWINSDDILCENALFAIAQSYLECNVDRMIIVGNGYEIDEGGNRVRERRVHAVRDSNMGIFEGIQGVPVQQSIFFSRKLYNEAGGVNPLIRYPMDIELYYKFDKLKPVVKVESTFLGCFRKHSASKTVGEDYKMLLEKVNLLAYLGYYGTYRNQCENQISAYITSFSFKGIGVMEKWKLLRVFIKATPIDRKNRYKYRVVLSKLINGFLRR